MLREVERFPIPLLKRREFITKLKGLGLIVNGGHIYFADLKERTSKTDKHYLPVAVIEMFSYRPVNLDEPSFRDAHEKIKKIYDSIVA